MPQLTEKEATLQRIAECGTAAAHRLDRADHLKLTRRERDYWRGYLAAMEQAEEIVREMNDGGGNYA